MTIVTSVMDDKTLEALNGSIEKWQKIVDGTGKDHGASNCPLCMLFNDAKNVEADRYCKGCPVAETVGYYGCEETPFDDWVPSTEELEFEETETGYKHTPGSLAAAQDELAFLKSLLPNTP